MAVEFSIKEKPANATYLGKLTGTPYGELEVIPAPDDDEVAFDGGAVEVTWYQDRVKVTFKKANPAAISQTYLSGEGRDAIIELRPQRSPKLTMASTEAEAKLLTVLKEIGDSEIRELTDTARELADAAALSAEIDAMAGEAKISTETLQRLAESDLGDEEPDLGEDGSSTAPEMKEPQPLDPLPEHLRRKHFLPEHLRWKHLNALPEREKRIVELRFGLEGEPWTLEAIGKELNLSRERVRQLEGQAHGRLMAMRDLADLADSD